MISQSDLVFLHAALDLAARGLYSATPNPRVGCLIARDGTVLGRGWHVRAGEGHAEVNALADAGGAARGATVYVSQEPCSFHGRTPPCAAALIDAGVARVVAAMTDPHPQVSGEGFAQLARAGIEVAVAEMPEARTLNAGYLKRLASGRPLVRLKVAASLDGRTAMASGESQWITGAAARAEVQEWRARSCAIVSGSGTVLADDPRFTVRDERFAVDGHIRQPLRVIVDSRLRVKSGAAVFAEPGETLLVHVPGARRQVSGVEHLAIAALADSREGADGERQLEGHGDAYDRVALDALLDELGMRGCNEVLVEAGAGLVGGFLGADLWDELLVYVAPRLLGSNARPLADLPLTALGDAVQGKIAESVMVGEDLRVRLTRS